MMGGALGLAVLRQPRSSRTDTLTAGGDSHLAALNGGYHAAFVVGAISPSRRAAIGVSLLRVRTAAGAAHDDEGATATRASDGRGRPLIAHDRGHAGRLTGRWSYSEGDERQERSRPAERRAGFGTTVLAIAKSEGYVPHALSFQYGQRTWPSSTQRAGSPRRRASPGMSSPRSTCACSVALP